MSHSHSAFALFFHSFRCICPLCKLLRLVMHTAVIPMAVLGPDETTRLTGGPIGTAAIGDGGTASCSSDNGHYYDIPSYGAHQARGTSRDGGESGTIGKEKKGKGRAKTKAIRTSRVSPGALAKLAPFLARSPHPQTHTPRNSRTDWSSSSTPSSSGTGSETESDSSSQRMGTSYVERTIAASVYGHVKASVKNHASLTHPYLPLPVDTKPMVRPDHRAVDVLPDRIVHNEEDDDFLDDRIRKHAIPVGGKSIAEGPLAGANIPLYAPTPSYSPSSTSTSFSSCSRSGLLASSPLSPSSPSSTYDPHILTPSPIADFNRSHLYSSHESIRSVDARHLLDPEDGTRSIVETAPFTLAHTRLELVVHASGIAVIAALIVLSIWLTIADVRM